MEDPKSSKQKDQAFLPALLRKGAFIVVRQRKKKDAPFKQDNDAISLLSERNHE